MAFKWFYDSKSPLLVLIFLRIEILATSIVITLLLSLHKLLGILLELLTCLELIIPRILVWITHKTKIPERILRLLLEIIHLHCPKIHIPLAIHAGHVLVVTAIVLLGLVVRVIWILHLLGIVLVILLIVVLVILLLLVVIAVIILLSFQKHLLVWPLVTITSFSFIIWVLFT